MADVALPDGMVPEIMGGTILLDLADGSQVVIKVAKARWSLGAGHRNIAPDPTQWLDVDIPVIFPEPWYGVGFLPLGVLADGPGRPAFRLTHICEGSARFRLRLEGGPE